MPRGEKPNVLIVIVDQWRAQAFGYAGDPNARTPAIDALADESVDFRQAVAGSPVCCPSRAGMLTGQYPSTHRVYINDVPLEPTTETLGEVFRDAGYRTGYVGKWHLYGSPGGAYERRGAPVPREHRLGFDYWKAAECTHDYGHSLYYDGDDPEPRYWPGYDAFAQTEDVQRFIEDAVRDDEPYLMVLSLGPPHDPYGTAPEPYLSEFAEAEIVFRPNVPPEAREDHQHDFVPDYHWYGPTAMRGYYAHGAAIDRCIADLLRTIDASGRGDDTIVVFLADHGDMLGSQGMGSKGVPWDESVRIPWLVRYPARWGREGSVSDVPIDTPDLFPMLLGLCGLPVPDRVEGRDPFASDAAHVKPSAFLTWSTHAQGGIGEYRGVRTPTHTYVRSRSGPWLLYDNTTDPYQMRNLVADPDSSARVAELDAELTGWLERLGDAFGSAKDDLERDGWAHYAEQQVEIGRTVSPWGDWESPMEPAPEGPRSRALYGSLRSSED